MTEVLENCGCEGVKACKTHFEAKFVGDYRMTPQYAQQYGGFRGRAAIGWPGNGLGVVKAKRDDDEEGY